MSFRQQQFRKLFQPEVFRKFRADYEGINPDRPLETAGIRLDQTEPLFRAFVWGDVTYWWIFGDECLMGMLRSSGFKDVKMMLKADCDSRNPANPKVTVEGHPAGARAWFTATKA